MKTNFLNFTIALIALLSFTITDTLAQSPKAHSPFTSQDLGKTLKFCYDISGLGNVDNITATLTYTATVSSECYNPGKDAGPVPGQSQTFSGIQEEVVIPVHNGRATGCSTTIRTFSPGACPNSKWTGLVSDVTFSAISLNVEGKLFTIPTPTPVK